MTACVNDELASYEKSGSLHFALCENGAVFTRATPAELGKPLAEKFDLKVQDVNLGRMVYDGAFKEEVEVNNGTYRITASYGKNPVLDIDKPYFLGEAEATLDADHRNPQVNVACRVANALISVKFLNAEGDETSESFDNYFSSYKIRVQIDNAYVFLTDKKQSAYFRPGSTPRVSFIGIIRDTNEEYTFNVPQEAIPTTIEAAQNIILKLQMEATGSGVTFDVHKAEVKTVTISEVIPLEWVPAPKIAEIPERQMIFETSTEKPQAVFPITLNCPLQDMELTLNLEDPVMSSLNGTYLLSELTDEQRNALTEVGIILPTIGDAPESIDGLHFEDFASKLRTNEGNITSNTLSLRVKANNRWNSESPISTTLFIARPRFTMPELNEAGAWSKTLYFSGVDEDHIQGAGTAVQEVLNRIQYELSNDGGETWTLANTAEAAEMLYTNNLQSNCEYLLRAIIKGTSLVSDNIQPFHTEEELGVPNGSFEELTEKIELNDLHLGGQYRVMWVHMQPKLKAKISEPNGWATINQTTCDLENSVTLNSWFVVPSTFNSNSGATFWSQDIDAGTSLAPNGDADRFKGYTSQDGEVAMILQNVAWDRNGTVPKESGGFFNTTYYCTNSPSSFANQSAGELFLQDENGEGNNFASRPTGLQFYYQYKDMEDSNERGVVQLELLNGETVVATSTAKLAAANDWTQASVNLDFNTMKQKANRLRLKFKSSDAKEIKTKNRTQHYQCSTGATLVVDNLTFVYGR